MKRGAPRRMAALQARFGHRAPRPAPQPPAPPPPLTPEQLRDINLYHAVNLDAIATGTADPQLLWDYVGGVLTWWKVSRLLQVGEPEMDLQLEVATRLVERFGRHRRVLFDGTDLQLARDGVVVMDLLASQVDVDTGMVAATWSTREVTRIIQAATQLLQQEERAAA